jgi:hypothetical protein
MLPPTPVELYPESLANDTSLGRWQARYPWSILKTVERKLGISSEWRCRKKDP